MSVGSGAIPVRKITTETAYVNFASEANAAYAQPILHWWQRRGIAPDGEHHSEAQTSPTIRYDRLLRGTLSDIQEAFDVNTILTQTDALAESPLFQPNAPGGIDCIQVRRYRSIGTGESYTGFGDFGIAKS